MMNTPHHAPGDPEKKISSSNTTIQTMTISARRMIPTKWTAKAATWRAQPPAVWTMMTRSRPLRYRFPKK